MKKVAKRRILSTLLVILLGLSFYGSSIRAVKTESATISDNDVTSYIELVNKLSGYDAIDLFESEKVSKEKNDVVQVSASPYMETRTEEPEQDAVETEVEEETPSIVETELEPFQKYTNTTVNIRFGPDTSYDVIKTISIGSYITLSASESNGWYRVNMIDGTYGYICGDYLQDEPPIVSIGNYVISYYCPCAKCCGRETHMTASGHVPIEGITVATSSNIPFGTRLIIDGHEYIVQDRGGSYIEGGERIDVYMDSHAACLQQGLHTSTVYQVIE